MHQTDGPTQNFSLPVKSLLSLSEAAAGKIALVLDIQRKELVLIGELRPEFLANYALADQTDGQSFRVLRELAYQLGEKKVQLHRDLPRPKDLFGPILGGTAAYFDGKGKLVLESESSDFGPLHRGLLTTCLGDLGHRLVFGYSIGKETTLLTPELEKKIRWELRS